MYEPRPRRRPWPRHGHGSGRSGGRGRGRGRAAAAATAQPRRAKYAELAPGGPSLEKKSSFFTFWTFSQVKVFSAVFWTFLDRGGWLHTDGASYRPADTPLTAGCD